MQSFHVAIHTRPAAARVGEVLQVAGQEVATLIVPAHDPLPLLSVTFEDAMEKLAKLPRMFCEPDGSFVWVAESGEPPWQVDGTLYDGPGRLAYVEVKGTCPESSLNRLLEIAGWPEAPLMFQFVRQGIFVDEAALRIAAQT